MRKIFCFLAALLLCTTSFDVAAATRGQSVAPTRQSVRTKTEATNRTTSSRTATNNTTTRRPATTAARSAINKSVIGRGTNIKSVSPRIAQRRNARAATNIQTKTFSTNYNTCRDSYFTCMDQFCATQNDTYRRCVCSSKLKDIQSKEKTLSQTSDSLKDFESLNVEMISKSSNEVKAMLSATDGETGTKKDTAASATTLQNISNVIDNTRNKSASLSTQGKLDIGGNIKSIWSTTALIGGADIANLTGESLFNAVHAQCSELVANDCAGSDLKMVASAYGMYIENDCAMLETSIAAKKTVANAAIRQTRHKMQDARLENYDAHNSASITECISKVRQDILADTACGAGYIHCLDFSGRYLDITTGKPIYSPEFYQIENQISLSGDILKNNQNAYFVSMLNKKRSFAQKDLDLCRDDADEVWNEFMRQAIVEIYQAQQQRVKDVKNECLKVVNDCYLNKSEQLSSLSDNVSKVNIAQTMELSEEMCNEQLTTCSNLYGGGTDGLAVLVESLAGITNATIEQSCPALLNTFAKKICSVLDNDSVHSYPYGCRKYAPGESYYARVGTCNKTLTNPFSRSEILTTLQIDEPSANYLRMCSMKNYTKRYVSCKPNYYLYDETTCGNTNKYCHSSVSGTECRACPTTAICAGGTYKPTNLDENTDKIYNSCGEYYIGSLYQQFVIYAMQNCRRPSDTSDTISETLLMEIDNIMRNINASMNTMLSQECLNQSGEWVNIPWIDKDMNGVHDNNNDTLHTAFYIATGANILWGYCRQSKTNSK